MKAVQLHRFGSPDALQLVDLPTPEPGPGQVLVRVHASGINFADTLMRQDRYAITPPLPAVLGSEVAGTIEALGAGVTYTSGARVAAPLFATNSLGGYAEYAVIAADHLAPLPDAVTFDAAAALMVQGLTALHLVRRSDPAGKVVLVSAAAGGVGSILVQLLRRAGARKVIAAASSAEKLAFAQGLGADLGIDYTQDDWVERLTADLGGSGPDIIYESAGGAVTPACLKVLAPLGQIIVYGALNIQAFALGAPELLSLIFKNQSLTGFAFAPLLDVHSLKKDLGELFELVAAGELKVAIGERYSLENVGEAHRKLEARGTMGKVLLAVGA
jgi:NADPH:quinone reductase